MSPDRTERLLGDPARWDAVEVELCSVHPLWGGSIVSVAGWGRATGRRIAPGAHTERRYEVTLSREETAALLRLLIAHDLLAVELPERRMIIPDEMSTTLTLRGV